MGKKHMKRWQVEVAIPNDRWVKGYCYVSYPSEAHDEYSLVTDRYYEEEVEDIIQSAKDDGFDKIRYRYAGAIWNYIK